MATANVDYNRINLRLSHPTLFRAIMTFAILSICLGLNFLFTKPTFNGYGIPKTYVGLVFLILGILKVIFLIVHRNLKAVRFTMVLEICFMAVWGIGTSITYFRGTTSLQLFVLYVGWAVHEIFLLNEPFWNPKTAKKEAADD